MKSYLLLFFIFFSLSALAQDYYVSRVVGQVYNGKLLVKSGDQLDSLAHLTSKDPNAMLRVIHIKKGSYTMSFQSGNKFIINSEDKKIELYELIVQDYINRYTSFRSLSTKNIIHTDDWFDFFTSSSIKSGSRKILLIANEKIALKSRSFQPHQKYKLFACTYNNNSDNLCKEIPIVNDSIYFYKGLFPQNSNFKWRLKLSEIDNASASDLLTITDSTLTGNILSRLEFIQIIGAYDEMLEKSSLKAGEVKKELFDFIEFNYGAHISPFINKYINEDL